MLDVAEQGGTVPGRHVGQDPGDEALEAQRAVELADSELTTCVADVEARRIMRKAAYRAGLNARAPREMTRSRSGRQC